MEIGNIIATLQNHSLSKDNRAVFPCSEIRIKVDMLSEDAYNYYFEQSDVLDIFCEMIHDSIAHDVSIVMKSQDGFFELKGF